MVDTNARTNKKAVRFTPQTEVRGFSLTLPNDSIRIYDKGKMMAKTKLRFDSWLHHKMAQINQSDERFREVELRKLMKVKPILRKHFKIYVKWGLTKNQITREMEILLMELFPSRNSRLQINNLKWIRYQP